MKIFNIARQIASIGESFDASRAPRSSSSLLRAGAIASAAGLLALAAIDASANLNARALAVGTLNTLRVAGVGMVAAIVLGAAIGIALVSSSRSISTPARFYVALVRNVPLLLQVLCWYSLLRLLPDAQEPWHPFAGLVLGNRGLVLFGGALSVSLEFAALAVALATYSAAFIAENVRGGIVAVAREQTEAAAALGLSRLEIVRLVVVPQALPVIVPPTTSELMNIAKNSSLAMAIGYPDLLSVTDTTLNQTGQAIGAVTVAMIIYLLVCFWIAVVVHLTVTRRYAS